MTPDEAKRHLAEVRRFAAIASNSASAAARAGREAEAQADLAAGRAMAARWAGITVARGDPGAPPSWDGETNTLSIPAGETGDDGTSMSIRIATTETAEALSVQHPGDLIVVPA
ncbi:MAG: hypothetical protein Q4G25_12740 [Paracoccus sp. (in: a-proteobacteria)]|nr:hypothetical protein [Paracoccus sp. (in: a-proteobacteria)]